MSDFSPGDEAICEGCPSRNTYADYDGADGTYSLMHECVEDICREGAEPVGPDTDDTVEATSCRD